MMGEKTEQNQKKKPFAVKRHDGLKSPLWFWVKKNKPIRALSFSVTR